MFFDLVRISSLRTATVTTRRQDMVLFRGQCQRARIFYLSIYLHLFPIDHIAHARLRLCRHTHKYSPCNHLLRIYCCNNNTWMVSVYIIGIWIIRLGKTIFTYLQYSIYSFMRQKDNCGVCGNDLMHCCVRWFTLLDTACLPRRFGESMIENFLRRGGANLCACVSFSHMLWLFFERRRTQH